ncbi:23S rRNA (uracil(1939)-C(5))-methyltransferase RlmD [Clostridium sp. DJ247]|uniref:23S rRNA (uracil(1939)-C(5))-methyltransferase RlmD n=1 Tax=Clostridium sp. DJ247 TaxID=2726188 RepID=UPI001624E624|nr:23S rRNA (uracil(1939)-C(5))-methyltransferase RlmD [Clostridium sp. DJ247]MBC2581591.1 23S rRNA (uracil(1939)-C(5))-methyltransferase RlmD [Clostridium sp. DJ247]
MKKGNEYEFYIEKTQFPGTGVAMYDGIETLIKGAVPGQKVKARVTKKKKDYAEARMLEVLENVEHAVPASCKHFGYCGGCGTQFLPYDKQLELKEHQVLELLNKGDINNFEFLGIDKSPEEFEYRNKMEFSFGDFEKGGELTLGMHIKGKSFGIINVEECQIVDKDFRVVLDTVVNYFRTKNVSYYKIMKREGYLRNLVIRKGKNTGEILINIVTTSQLEFSFEELTEILVNLDYSGELKGILHTINDSYSDVVQADSVKILFGREYIMEEILGLKFKIYPESFFQTNSKGAEVLYSIVKDFLGDASSKVIFDLYCGTGTIGQIVAKDAKKVLGIELIEEAVKSANENAKINGLTNCSFIAGDVAEVIKNIKDKPDIIILDPPRPGVHPTALEYVTKFNAPSIIYVSCNPKTLVTDLKILQKSGYSVEKIKLMDMFPHTPHVECVVRLERKHI